MTVHIPFFRRGIGEDVDRAGAWVSLIWIIWLALFVASCTPGRVPVLEGEFRKWHTMGIRFAGPAVRQTDNQPNPFLDYRLQVMFTAPDGRAFSVPGFFDGDGKGSGEGNVWTVRFTPDQAGTWRYRASFRAGPGIAVSLEPDTGTSAAFDGTAGSFSVADRDPRAPGFLASGRLEYVGGYYLKSHDGSYFLKGGSNEPENFLAYAGFRNTYKGPAGKYFIHQYAGHVADWKSGDPDWGGGKGKGIIGLLNYLGSQHVNSLYFLPMNIGGDGQDVWPFVSPLADPAGSPKNDDLHYDVGKLAEWETVFAHAQRQGILLHIVLNESEALNKRELDDATLGPERKLYYREMVARFAHHNAIQWNLCEEYDDVLDENPVTLTPQMVKEWAGYLKALDPYSHPIAVHNQQRPTLSWEPFFGDQRFSATSFQYHEDPHYNAGHHPAEGLPLTEMVKTLRARSREKGRPIPICIDESDRAGRKDDESHGDKWPYMGGHSRLRKAFIWPVYLAGGHLEFILEGEANDDDWRPFEGAWQYAWYARKFLEQSLPFWEMESADEFLTGEAPDFGGGHVFRKAGKAYAIYLPKAAPSGTLDLRESSGSFEKRWYNPRTGAFAGVSERVSGGGPVPLGFPPSAPSQDWAVLLLRAGGGQ